MKILSRIFKPFLALFLGWFYLTRCLFAEFSTNNFPPSLKPATEDYQVQVIMASAEPGILKFQIHTPHSAYETEGFLTLVKLVQEIEFIEQVRKDQKTSGFFDGASASVESTGKGLINLAEHPVASVKGVGKAAGKLGRSFGGMFRKKEKGEKTGFSEKVLGGEERELARQFGVDVYTRNPHLKKILSSMARSRAGGKGAVMVIKFLLPVAGLASIALTAGGINGAADEVIRSSSRGDLYRLNQEALTQMNFSEQASKKFLDSPWYTPTEATYLRFYLEKLKEAEGNADLFEKLQNAGTALEAYRFFAMAQMAAVLQDKTPVKRMMVKNNFLGLWHEGGSLRFVFPFDYLEETELANRLNQEMAEILKPFSSGPGHAEAVLGGFMAPELRRKWESSGIKVREGFYFEEKENPGEEES